MKYNISTLIGKGYNRFWNFQGRYRVVKGSRASKKSRTTAYWIILNMMNPAYQLANTLIIRKTERTLKDSCYSELLWVIHHLKLEKFWKYTRNPLEMTYLKTGQKILFRGLDDPLKLASISVPIGYLCWVWIEEAYEITNEQDFNMLDESIRGELPAPLFHQLTLTFNPWLSSHWLKLRFFDNSNIDTLAITTTYKMNEWLDQKYINLLETMKYTNPRRYQVSALGEWGALGNQIYENYQVFLFNPEEVPGNYILGLDFGFANDPTAFFVGKIDTNNNILYVINEVYQKGLWNDQIKEEINKICHFDHSTRNNKFAGVTIYADCSAPKDVSELITKYNLPACPCRKGKDSLLNGIGFLQNFKILIHPICKNFLYEIENYVYERDKTTNEPINKPIDKNNHLMDAMRYAIEDYLIGHTVFFEKVEYSPDTFSSIRNRHHYYDSYR